MGQCPKQMRCASNSASLPAGCFQTPDGEGATAPINLPIVQVRRTTRRITQLHEQVRSRYSGAARPKLGVQRSEAPCILDCSSSVDHRQANKTKPISRYLSYDASAAHVQSGRGFFRVTRVRPLFSLFGYFPPCFPYIYFFFSSRTPLGEFVEGVTSVVKRTRSHL